MDPLLKAYLDEILDRLGTIERVLGWVLRQLRKGDTDE